MHPGKWCIRPITFPHSNGQLRIVPIVYTIACVRAVSVLPLHLATAMTLSRCLIALVIFPAVAAPLHGQAQRSYLSPLSIDKGLSFSCVNAILQDRRGFLWFGTANGLNRYDGGDFVVYRTDPAESTSISANEIRSMFEDRHGDLWIDASTELNRFDRIKGTFTRCLRGAHLVSMYEDTSAGPGLEAMWFATNGSGLYRYDRNTQAFTRYRHNPGDLNSLSSDSVISLFVDRKGTLWIGAINGLNSLDTQRGQFTHYPDGPAHQVQKIIQDRDTARPVLWIGTDDGLYAYDYSARSFSHYRNRFARPGRSWDNWVVDLYCDHEDSLWVLLRLGIARFDRVTMSIENYQSCDDPIAPRFLTSQFLEDRTGVVWAVRTWNFQIAHDPVKHIWDVHSYGDIFWALSMLEDNTGTKWFGTMSGGLRKVDKSEKQFEFFTVQPGDTTSLSFQTVNGIWEDHSGFAWIGTADGLNKLDPSTGRFRHYLPEPGNGSSLIDGGVCRVLEDRQGALWVGTAAGLDKFDRKNNTFKHYVHDPRNPSSLTSDFIHLVLQDREGRLWVVPANGVLEEFNRRSNTFLHHFPGYPKTPNYGRPTSLIQDSGGLLWLGLESGGVTSYNPATGKFVQYVHSADPATGRGSLSQNDVASILEDHNGVLWIGTRAGLNRFDRSSGTFSQVSVRDGLASDWIGGILEDGHGRLWLGTAKGISRYDPRTGAVRNFDASDGVKFDVCENAHKGGTGYMYFGGFKGFVRFHPDSIRDNTYVPPVVITEFRVFDKPARPDTAISEKKSLELSYRDNVFSFAFAALNYTHPEKNQYAYKLEGFDRDWVYCGSRRTASYTNLEGGSYTFRVKGSNNDGVWNDAGTSILVTIIPPFWATLWFTVLVLTAAVLSVGGATRFILVRRHNRTVDKLKYEGALEQERLRISQDMHDEVGASLTEIALLSELTKKDIEERHETMIHAQQISDKVAEVIDTFSQIIWALNPKNDTLDNLIAHVRHYVVRYLGMTPIRCIFDIPEAIPPLHVSAEARRNLFLVVKEAVHNVVKHSKASEVRISMTMNSEAMEINIADNGEGFSLEEREGTGNGLGTMRRRIEDLRGRFLLESNHLLGSIVKISLPLGSSG